MSSSVHTPLESVDVAQAGLLKKALATPGSTMISAMFAGALIGLGFVFYTTTQVGAADGMPYGVAKALGGLAFSGGLAAVIILGADLFTSTTMTPMIAADGKLKVGRLFRHWGLVYLFNMLGAAVLVTLVYFSGTGMVGEGKWAAVVMGAAEHKVEHTFVAAFCLGILCNVLVCLASWMGMMGRTLADKFVAVLFPISLFIATGFEHSVANMFVIPMGLVFKSDPAILDAAGAGYEGLTVGAYLLHNLLPVTLGNIVGGLIVGFGMWGIHRSARRKLAATQA